MTSTDTQDLADMVEMALRIVLDDEVQLGRYGPSPTADDIERFRVHVLKLRLMGVLRQELCLKLLDSANAREARLRRPLASVADQRHKASPLHPSRTRP